MATRLADLYVNASCYVFASSTQVAFLTGETLFEVRQLVAQPDERLARVIDLGHLCRQAAAQPVAHSQPKRQDGISEGGIGGIAQLLQFGQQDLPAARTTQAFQ